MKQFALILAFALLFTAAQAALEPCVKDEDCGNIGIDSTNDNYRCCAYLKGTYNGQPINEHVCMNLAVMQNFEKHQRYGDFDKAYCDSASYITAAFATVFVSIFTLSF